jgi:hypothetical protein
MSAPPTIRSFRSDTKTGLCRVTFRMHMHHAREYPYTIVRAKFPTLKFPARKFTRLPSEGRSVLSCVTHFGAEPWNERKRETLRSDCELYYGGAEPWKERHREYWGAEPWKERQRETLRSDYELYYGGAELWNEIEVGGAGASDFEGGLSP